MISTIGVHVAVVYQLPWEPTTFIFRGYDVITFFEGLKPPFFHGFWAPRLIPSKGGPPFHDLKIMEILSPNISGT